MSSTTGIKLDAQTKERIKEAANRLDRTPHWLMKKAIVYWLARVEAGASVSDLLVDTELDDDVRLNSVFTRRKLLSVD